MAQSRSGASPEKVGWKTDRIDGQKVYLTIFMSFLLRNEYRPEESGVDMSTPVHPVAPPLAQSLHKSIQLAVLERTTKDRKICMAPM